MAEDLSDPVPLCELARALCGAQRWDEAISAAESAVGLAPADEWPQRLRAIARLGAGRKAEAEDKATVLHRGIATRAFERRFQLADHVRAVVAIGEAAPEVSAAFDGVRPVEVAHSMADAVATAARLARPGDAVLLSPACASFDWYASYAARGDDFAAAVHALEETR